MVGGDAQGSSVLQGHLCAGHGAGGYEHITDPGRGEGRTDPISSTLNCSRKSIL